MKRLIIFISSFLLASGQVVTAQAVDVNYYRGNKDFTLVNPCDDTVTVTILYDNYISAEGMKEDWGYSCYIEGLEKTILFDTGANPAIFLHNIQLAGIRPEEIDEVFLSHDHGDHTAGLPELLKMTTDLVVVVPETFGNNFFRSVIKSGAEVAKVNEPVEICENLYSTGIMGILIPEQALVINTGRGLVVMTGCSHPGIIEMLKTIKATFGKDIYMVFGGFHLLNYNEKQMDSIINDMKELGITKCGATHCTGESQIEMFRKAFGENFVTMGAGNRIIFF